jgi:HEAT repeat protein
MRSRLLLLVGALFGLAVCSQAPSPGAGGDKAAQARGGQDAIDIPGIVFVGAPIFDPRTDGGDGVYQGAYHWRDGYVYARSATFNRAERTMGPVRPGRNLYSLVPAQADGKLTRLTHLKTGSVFKPEPSFDGKKVLFAMRRDGEDWFHLYEVNVDGTGLRQLTDGPFNDFAGVYLPDGRIVFCSDRTGYLEEYHEERTETLFLMNGDGRGIQQLTFAPGTYFEPAVLRDGRILFSFWDAFHIDVPPFDKHETYLMTVNPDGTEERQVFGAGRYRFFNRERHSAVGLTQAREMPDGRILVQSEMGPALLDLRAGLSVRDALTPIFPGTTSVQLGGTTHRVHLSPLGTRSTPYPLQDGRFLYSATLPGARDSGIYVADPDTRSERLVINIPNYAEFDAVPVLVERPQPAVLPKRVRPKSDTARFLVVAGRTADNPERAAALKRARYFRVIEAEYTGVTTSSHTNLETRILGTVPILADGSAYFEAPADTPLFLDPVDAAGNRVLMEWSYPNTAVAVGTHYPSTQMAYMVGRRGETKGCYGCHAPQTEAVPNVALEALKHPPVKVARHSLSLEYRRNEPEAYRRQARIGEAPKYRPWLMSKDPILRARACEMLMYIEDGTERDVPVIAGLLKDPFVEVRRAAALALTRLATVKQMAALEAALKDDDWLVRDSAGSAIEAMSVWTTEHKEALITLFTEGVDNTRYADGGAFNRRATAEQKVNQIISQSSCKHLENLWRRPLTAKTRRQLHEELNRFVPDVLAFRAAGKAKDATAVKLLVPWLRKHVWEYHAAEAAVALGRIGTAAAVEELWKAVRSEVPIRQVHISRYLQHGPRPEEYALLKGLILAGAKPDLKDVHLLIALLPNTFTEKPRFEDRLRAESQRVLMPRLLLENAGFRQRVVAILVAALRGGQKKSDPLYEQLLKGINLERPFSEHGRPFDVVQKIGAEEALWLLANLLDPAADLGKVIKAQDLEDLVVPHLTNKNHRERIDAAMLLGRTGFGPKAAQVLAAEVSKPYSFPEIWSIGKGMPDVNFRDKAYLVQTLARHIDDVNKLKPFADPKKMTRDVRYGLTHGLAFRGKPDGIPLLIEMATSDPITLVRQQARYGLADIQDACRMAGKPVPKVTLPEAKPLEALYPPRGLKWSDTQFVEFRRDVEPCPADAAGLRRALEKCLKPGHFRNLNNAQASGAQYMMTESVEETRRAFEALARLADDAARPVLLAALDTPYPFAHYLALKGLADRKDQAAVPVLLKKLDAYLKVQDMVGFWWCCEALRRLKAREATPVLASHAVSANPAGTFGPEGMAAGYIAAKALAQITADARKATVAGLLKSDNIWLRAGALRGLAEAKAPGVEALLRQADDQDNLALVRHEARVQLRRLSRNR